MHINETKRDENRRGVILSRERQLGRVVRMLKKKKKKNSSFFGEEFFFLRKNSSFFGALEISEKAARNS
eukprot:344185-Prymnesium_polylepis.1